MKPIPTKIVRCHIGVTLPGTTTNSLDTERCGANIFMMPWGFDVFFKEKKYMVPFSNVTASEYDSNYDGPTYEQCDHLCKQRTIESKQAISA